MNLFKRARSATGRGMSANDTQPPTSSSRTTQAISNDISSSSHIPSPECQSSPAFASNPAFSRKITYRTHDESSDSSSFTEEYPIGLTPHPPKNSSRGVVNAHETYPDFYARNALETFVFGAGSSSSSRSSPIDPHFIPDEQGSECTHTSIDSTPRPSIIVNTPLDPRSDDLSPNPRSRLRTTGTRHYGYKVNSESVHTFGHLSASASVSSLVGPLDSNSELLSPASSYFSPVPKMGTGFTSASSDDDGQNTSDVGDLPWNPNRQKAASPLFLSDEELDIYEYDAEHEAIPTRRKGSAAIPIVHASAHAASLRRGSRSLDELHSLNFLLASSSSVSRTPDGITIPSPSPSSVPQSEYEIENVRKKSLPPLTSKASGLLSHSPVSESTTLDLSWMESFGRNGIVGFNNDDMADIVDSDDTLSTIADRTSKIRRHSTFSTTTVDIMLKNIQAWNSGSQKYQDQRRLWLFEKENYDSMLPHRERPSISYFFSSRSNTVTDTSLIAPFLEHAHAQKEKEKKFPKETWKGMPLGTEEYWLNGWSGRIRVSRRNTSSNPEVLQQRLIFSYTRNQDGHDRTATDKPTVTIHKHSKTIAFSISRTYRQRNPSTSNNNSRSLPTPRSPVEKKKIPILLAPRRVQVSYTSTTTTRKLESHGLLDDNGRKNMKDIERMARMQKEREREERKKGKERAKIKGKERERVMEVKGSDVVESKSYSEGKEKETKLMGSPDIDHLRPDSVMNAESHSIITQRSLEDSNTPSLLTITTPEDATSSFSQTLVVSPMSSAERPSFYRRRVSTFEIEDDDEDDNFESYNRQSHRSNYRETYASLPPEAFESGPHEHTLRIFGWPKSKTDRLGHRSYFDTPYNPPWLTQPKNSSITRKDIVEDLNMSFQDVGLLPAIGEIKHTGLKSKRKKSTKKVKSPVSRYENRTDIFTQIPEEVLYMILPLWPGETDAPSAKRYPFTPPPVPVEKRLYLLVYYKTMPYPDHQDDKSNKKRAKSDLRDDRYIFMNSFHISARVVSYQELQGSCIRIPDHGLAVCGPLQEAYQTMPTNQPSDSCIIGLCSNRETGFEFVPEGFEKMGLSQNVPNPRMESFNTDDDSSSMDTLAVPTPIGHAVMEMAWFGGMALSGFHRDSQWRG